MRHRKSGRRLGRDTAHRRAMMANLAISLFQHERITTTLPRAKELRSFAERLITMAKRDTLHARRRVARVVHDNEVLKKVFSQLSPRYAERPGGYTRIYKLGHRKGDCADMAVIELVDRGGAAASMSAEDDAPSLIERDEDSSSSSEAKKDD